MASPVTSLGSCNEIIYCVLEYLEPETNVEVMAVCANWRDIAADIAKKQYCTRAEKDLNLKMTNFLAMAGGTAIDYCPALKKLRDERTNFSVKGLCDQLEGFTEKHKVALGSCHIVDDKSELLKTVLGSIIATGYFVGLTEEAHAVRMEGMKRILEDLEGSRANPSEPFISLNLLKDDNRIDHQWMSGGISFFPIALFNLKIQGREIIGQEPEGSYCISLKGRLIELIIVPPNPDLYYRRDSEIPHMPQVLHLAYFDPRSEALASLPK